MRMTEQTMNVAVFKCSQDHAWYEYLPKPTPLIVTESGTPGDWYIAYGEHAGYHVAKEDCTSAIDTEVVG